MWKQELAQAYSSVDDLRQAGLLSPSEAARLESLAQPGQILITEQVWHYTEKHHGDFQFTPMSRKLDKDVGKLRAGDDVLCYAVEKRR